MFPIISVQSEKFHLVLKRKTLQLFQELWCVHLLFLTHLRAAEDTKTIYHEVC